MNGETLLERILMAISATLTLALFAIVGWQAVAGSEGTDLEAYVTGLRRGADGVEVHLRIENHAATGLRNAMFEVDCGEQVVLVEVQDLPASARRSAVALCPERTDGASVRVVSWVQR